MSVQEGDVAPDFEMPASGGRSARFELGKQSPQPWPSSRKALILLDLSGEKPDVSALCPFSHP